MAEDTKGYMTNLPSISLAEWKDPGGKQILPSVVDGTRREDLRS